MCDSPPNLCYVSCLLVLPGLHYGSLDSEHLGGSGLQSLHIHLLPSLCLCLVLASGLAQADRLLVVPMDRSYRFTMYSVVD